MVESAKITPLSVINSICLVGLFSIFIAIKELFIINNKIALIELLMFALMFFIFSPWKVSLPSGAFWRPGIIFILFSLLYFDYKIAILVAVPGLLYNGRKKKTFLVDFMLSIGHLSLGIYTAGFIYRHIEKDFSLSLYSYFAILICLCTHFCVNRIVSAFIISYKRKRSFIKQVLLIKNDLNWGYSCIYILAIMMFLLFRVYGPPGLILVIFLIITLYKSVSYFNKLKVFEKKAYTDVLTSAENRTSWEEFVEQIELKSTSKSGVIFMLDLDHFKTINDTYGHEYGDQILRNFVNYLKKEVSKVHRLFRYGGDEFILFVQSTEEEYLEICENIREVISSQNCIWRQNGLPVSVSYGHAFYSRNKSFTNILRSADKSMYLNKSEKKLVRNR